MKAIVNGTKICPKDFDVNARIQELAEQAAQEVRVAHNNPYWRMQDEIKEDAAWKEKFAELIVQECVDIAYEYDAPKMSGPGMIIAGKIESHFGVEE